MHIGQRGAGRPGEVWQHLHHAHGRLALRDLAVVRRDGAELQRANGITDPRSVRVGTVLKVPGNAVASAEPVAPAEPAAEAPARVADAAPVVVQTTHVPTVINRRDTQVASRDGDDVSTGTINPAPQREVCDRQAALARARQDPRRLRAAQ